MSAFAQLNAQLIQSIRDADREVLQATLISMCTSSAECLLQASSRLLVTRRSAENSEDDTDEDEEDDDDESDDEAPVQNAKKRKLTNSATKPILTARYRKCLTCKEMFDVIENNGEACKTHPGEKEIDVECFPDDDEIEYGPGPGSIDVDNDWRVQEFPEGFPWSCCDEPADHEGCVVQRHEV